MFKKADTKEQPAEFGNIVIDGIRNALTGWTVSAVHRCGVTNKLFVLVGDDTFGSVEILMESDTRISCLGSYVMDSVFINTADPDYIGKISKIVEECCGDV